MAIGTRSVRASQVFFDEDDSCYYVNVKVSVDLSELDFDFENYDYYAWQSNQQAEDDPITSPEQAKHLCENFDVGFSVLEVVPKGE